MDEIASPNPRRRRRPNGRRRGRNRGQRRRASQPANSGQLLTGHGRTVLGQRLTSLHRGLAAAAERHFEVSHDRRPGSAAELEELEQRVLALVAEINQIEGTLELAEHPELDIGQGIGPGSAVEVIDTVGGQRSEYRLVGADAGNDSTVVGVGSVVGQALLGRRPGSVVTVAGADGPRRVQIAAVRSLGANGSGPAA